MIIIFSLANYYYLWMAPTNQTLVILYAGVFQHCLYIYSYGPRQLYIACVGRTAEKGARVQTRGYRRARYRRLPPSRDRVFIIFFFYFLSIFFSFSPPMKVQPRFHLAPALEYLTPRRCLRRPCRREPVNIIIFMTPYNTYTYKRT